MAPSGGTYRSSVTQVQFPPPPSGQELQIHPGANIWWPWWALMSDSSCWPQCGLSVSRAESYSLNFKQKDQGHKSFPVHCPPPPLMHYSYLGVDAGESTLYPVFWEGRGCYPGLFSPRSSPCFAVARKELLNCKVIWLFLSHPTHLDGSSSPAPSPLRLLPQPLAQWSLLQRLLHRLGAHWRRKEGASSNPAVSDLGSTRRRP